MLQQCNMSKAKAKRSIAPSNQNVRFAEHESYWTLRRSELSPIGEEFTAAILLWR